MSEFIREPFKVDGMEFEIIRDTDGGLGGACIGIKGKNPKLILYTLPNNVTLDEARWTVHGYMKGLEQGHAEMMAAVRRRHTEDLKRSYHVEEVQR